MIEDYVGSAARWIGAVHRDIEMLNTGNAEESR
jgi:hypothetical protein